MAPRGTRSLLRRPCTGPWGRRIPSHGPWRTNVRRQTLRPRLHARLRAPRCGTRELAGARLGRCDLAGLAKVLIACGIGAAFLWFGATPALADTTPPPTTTTSDAPPPDPYAPPAPKVKPKVAAPRRSYTTPARTYAPSAPIASRPAVQTSQPHQRPKAVRHHRKQPVRQPAKAPPASAWLAPLPKVLTAVRAPLTGVGGRDHPYLWLAGLAFAVLAVAGLSLHRLSVRYFDLRFE